MHHEKLTAWIPWPRNAKCAFRGRDTKLGSPMNEKHAALIAQELSVAPRQVAAVAELLAGGDRKSVV